MICETCHGTGKLRPLPIPCGDCGGCGFSYCCGGAEVEQIIVSPEAYDEIVAMLEKPAVPTQTFLNSVERVRRLLTKPAPWDVSRETPE